MKNLIKIFIVIMTVTVLGGCGKSVEEKIFTHLENAVSLEGAFEEQQEPLIELEKKEQMIYEKIIKLGMDEFDEIKALSQEAIKIVDDRETRVEQEKKSIDQSKEQFRLVEKEIEKLKDEKAKETAKQLVAVMNERYDSYEKLYTYYKKAIDLDRNLYEMFQEEELTLEELEEQIKKINEMYDLVVQESKTFNELTENYNKKKKDFYIASGLNVVFENDASSDENK
ncbi:YkyA family protein [Calidifontibacillus erzurumensis]|nr:YkyA family protein [Calidifontibacillus erzurumensis]